jgi:hypothetical protein
MEPLHEFAYNRGLVPDAAVKHYSESIRANVVNDAPAWKLIVLGAERNNIAADELFPIVHVTDFVILEVGVSRDLA